MGWWERQVVPRIVDVAAGSKNVRPLRQRVCEGLAGDVVEVGFGTGHNLPYLPPSVTRLRAVDPSELGRRLARRRLQACTVPVEFAGFDGQALPFGEGEVEVVLTTFTLCTIPDPVAALAEMRRVLRPGGRLHFVEHGWAPDPPVQRWQRRLEPMNKRLLGGCHLTRDAPMLLREAGFVVDSLDQDYVPGDPKPFGFVSTGVASAPVRDPWS